jgi:hypothetical protein
MTNFFTGRSIYEQGLHSLPPEEIGEIAKHHFLNLLGGTYDYYGADTADNTFKIDNIIFKVLEDPDDGYRSYLGTIDYTDKHSSLFFYESIARVKIETYETISPEPAFGEEKNHGYRLVDTRDSHVWVEFGTHNYDDYYPCFIFRHFPKKPL